MKVAACLLLAWAAAARASSPSSYPGFVHRHRLLARDSVPPANITDDSDFWPEDSRGCSDYTTTVANDTCDALVDRSSTMLLADLTRLNPSLDCESPVPAGLSICTEVSEPTEAVVEQTMLEKRIGRLVTYPAPPTEAPSADYAITVNNRPVFCYGTYQYTNPSNLTIVGRPVTPTTFCYFDFQGTAIVNITLLGGLAQDGIQVASLEPHPVSAKLRVFPSGPRSFAFYLRKNGQFTFEPNGGLLHPLHIFANPLETRIPSPKDPNVIYFGPGQHTLQPMDLDDDAIVYIAGGAVVELAPVPEAQFISTQDIYGFEVAAIPPMFQAKYVSNIQIRGRGILCGRAALANSHQRGNMISFESIDTGKIDGIILRESAGWTISLPNSKRISVNNVKIVGHYVNNDGVVVASSNTIVQNSFVHNADDGLQIKSWEGNPVTSVVFRNNIVWSTVGGAMGVPCEVYSDISGVTWRDSTVLHSVDPYPGLNRGSVGINSQGPGSIKNLKFLNIAVEHSTADYPIRVNNNSEMEGDEDLRGPIGATSFSNVQVGRCDGCGTLLEGLSKSSNVMKVRLAGVRIKKRGLTAKAIRKNAFVGGVSVS